MIWDKLVDFINARDPAFASSIQGITRQDIRDCEIACSITLPRDYVEFLITMGKDSGDFRPFGATQVHDFSKLIEQLPAEDYPGDQFFKVAFESDPSEITWYDSFLDLNRSDEDDAPLVMFEDCGHFRLEQVIQEGFTFSEYLARSVFRYFELDRRPHKTTVLITRLSPEAAQVRKKSAVLLLAAMNFNLVLPAFLRVTCMRRGTMSALVGAHNVTSLLHISLSGDDRVELDIAVEQILDGLPEAEVQGSSRKPRRLR